MSPMPRAAEFLVRDRGVENTIDLRLRDTSSRDSTTSDRLIFSSNNSTSVLPLSRQVS